jgi:hypothetical protein
MGTWGGCEGCRGNRLYVWDVSDPARPTLTDSVMVDAQSINDVAVNEAGTLAAFGRRGASRRRNGVVLLDLADPRTRARWPTTGRRSRAACRRSFFRRPAVRGRRGRGGTGGDGRQQPGGPAAGLALGVTIRDRDSMQQTRLSQDEIVNWLGERLR